MYFDIFSQNHSAEMSCDLQFIISKWVWNGAFQTFVYYEIYKAEPLVFIPFL